MTINQKEIQLKLQNLVDSNHGLASSIRVETNESGNAYASLSGKRVSLGNNSPDELDEFLLSEGFIRDDDPEARYNYQWELCFDLWPNGGQIKESFVSSQLKLRTVFAQRLLAFIKQKVDSCDHVEVKITLNPFSVKEALLINGEAYDFPFRYCDPTFLETVFTQNLENNGFNKTTSRLSTTWIYNR